MLQLDGQVIRDADDMIDECNCRGVCDLQGICEEALALEDESPLKARALARVAGAAMWYADSLRSGERDQKRSG